MKTISLLLAIRPQLLRELVREIIERQPDMEIVGEVLAPLELLLTAKKREVDVVILGLKNSETSGLASHIFAECPHITILSLTCTGDIAFIEQLPTWRQEIPDPSAASLLSALRHATWERCGSEDEVDKQCAR